jgi:hypothetical protein
VTDAQAPNECLEVPRPLGLLRTIGWNLSEAFGLPTLGYVLGTAFGGRDAGLWAVLGAIWLTAGLRLLFTRSVPSLVLISLAVLTVQTATAIATGNLFIFLIHFPIANLALCVVFARTARGSSPIAARLAGEVIGLRCPPAHESSLHGFFQHVTVLWAGIFLLLAVILGALLVIVPVGIYVPIWAVTTITLIGAGIAVSALWLRSTLRKLGIGFQFAPTSTAQRSPVVGEDSP